jgi:FtsP/CotA-like multicopper oxidase with cupredoxin domain
VKGEEVKRLFLAIVAALISLAMVLPGVQLSAQIPGGTLDPLSIDKYVMPVIIPPAMPSTDKINVKGGKNIDYYEIAVRQFEQQILPPPLPMTTVWSYGSVNHPDTFNYPAFTIEAKYNTPVRVKWINELVDQDGNYLPHILPIDQTLHWANPPGGNAGRDTRPNFTGQGTPEPYTGPVPIVTHVHGAHTTEDSDGYPEAWYLPDANDIPAGYATEGTFYEPNRGKATAGNDWGPGVAVFQYPNDQRATTLWYHDHTLGMTRANVYAGPAGFYIIRGGPDDKVIGKLPGPAPAGQGSPFSPKYREIPLAIQDRSFNTDGSLFYPEGRDFFDGYGGPFIPDTPVSPIWNPEFLGNTMVVNGRTWPYLEVEQQRYRLRLLNGCNSRFLILKMDNGLPFWQIGAEGGFLPAPIELDRLLLGPAERADVIVDFSSVSPGTEVILLNLGPDEPFGGGVPGVDFDPAYPDTTGQVMMFKVVPTTGPDKSTPPDQLILPAITPLGPEDNIRQVSLNEEVYEAADIPFAALLGTVNLSDPDDPTGVPLLWADQVTENPSVGDTEIWEIYNFTEDAHPIHIHLVQFEVVDRIDALSGGTSRSPEAWETGFKDTVIAYPGEITRVKARFDLAGLFVWHCHIVEHEDNEMMRPYRVGP